MHAPVRNADHVARCFDVENHRSLAREEILNRAFDVGIRFRGVSRAAEPFRHRGEIGRAHCGKLVIELFGLQLVKFRAVRIVVKHHVQQPDAEPRSGVEFLNVLQRAAIALDA